MITNDLTLTTWPLPVTAPTYAPLAANIRVDVCIVGAGVAGLTTAYLLQREGKTICVLEANEIASGQSRKTTAHLSTAIDARYFDIEQTFGADGANLAAKSHAAALSQIESIVYEEKIECGFEWIDGYLCESDNSKPEQLDNELAASRRAGISGVALIENPPIAAFDRALKFPKQAQLHPARYLAAVARAISRDCGKIHTKTEVAKVTPSSDGRSAIVSSANGFTVTCQNVVIATSEEQTDFRNYIIAFKIVRGAVPRGLFWEAQSPSHFVRVESFSTEHELLIVGGEDFKSGFETEQEAEFEELEKWTRERLPQAKEVVAKWSGLLMRSNDGLALLGQDTTDRKNVFVVSGDSGNGITTGTIGAILISDQIIGRKNDWEELYNPGRTVRKKTGQKDSDSNGTAELHIKT